LRCLSTLRKTKEEIYMRLNLPNLGITRKAPIYTRASPLIPQKGGYPIQLTKKGNNKEGIGINDLQSEPTTVSIQGKTLVMPTYSPYMMQGAVDNIRLSNAGLAAQNDKIAEDLAAPRNNVIRQPMIPYKHLSQDELEAKSKVESEQAYETYLSNEKQAADPSSDPTWIMRPPQIGPKTNFR
jgi:hypothetical protein